MNIEKLLDARINTLLRENAKLRAQVTSKRSPSARQAINRAWKHATHFEQLTEGLSERVRVLEARIVRLQGGRSIARAVKTENQSIVASARVYANDEPRLRRQDIAARLHWDGGVPYQRAYKLISGIGFGAHGKRAKRLKRKMKQQL